MAEPRRAKRSKREGALEERRFEPVRTAPQLAIFAAGGVGSALLGAGVYAQFIQEPRPTYGAYIVGAGALLLAGVILAAPEPLGPLLVGDGGVAVDEQTDTPRRILWCDVKRVAITSGALVIEGKALTLTAPLASHGQAAAAIVREARARVPSVVEIDEQTERSLPTIDESAGERRIFEPTQLAGRRCKASDQIISFEPDARLCPRCCECYHRESIPETCLTCGGSLATPFKVAS